MSQWFDLLWRDASPWLLAATALLGALLYLGLAQERRTLKHTLLFLGVWLLVDMAAALFAWRQEHGLAGGLHQVALFGLGLVLIRLSGLLAFRWVLPRLGAPTPRIVEDIVVIAAYAGWLMVRLAYAGLDLSSLVATSAVITAVLAFAMQDTLGNILGGLALQLDNSLEVGDWVRVDDLSGRVIDIQWRSTAIMTRNGEKVVLPNSLLMKGKFSVIADREAGSPGWRRWVWFNVDYAAPPGAVQAVAERAVSEASIANVAATPAPSCVLMEFAPGSLRYALRYWLLDPADDDPTDSSVRRHVLAALQRHGWRIALPEQQVHLVKESEGHRDAVHRREQERRLAALKAVDLFAVLDDAERMRLAERLVYSPFAAGDVLTRQGAVAHWLYLLVSGEAEVCWQAPSGEQRQVVRLGAGQVFGEMGLMTGAARAATVVAVSDVECYRLDKAGFQSIIQARPDLAESLSHILAQRAAQLEALQSDFQRQHSTDHGARRADLLARMRRFFGLD